MTEGGNNWPLRGWKHSLWEGGMHGVGFVTGGAFPDARRGTTYNGLIHVSDWFPTIVEGVVGASVNGTKLDGHNVWDAVRFVLYGNFSLGLLAVFPLVINFDT